MKQIKVREVIKNGKTKLTSNSNDDLLKYVKIIKLFKKYNIKI